VLSLLADAFDTKQLLECGTTETRTTCKCSYI
jgi:hypothetical protein